MRLLETLKSWLKSFEPYDPSKLSTDDLRAVALDDAPIRQKTSRVVILAFVIFCVWAVLAPLDDGVVAPGTVVVKGNRKAVQHPSGGVVQEIFVKEGDHVKKDDPLLSLNPLTINAQLNAAELEHINVLSALSRVMSERLHRESIQWLEKLSNYAGDPRLAEAQRLQIELFKSRTAEIRGQQSILREQLAGHEAHASGLDEVIRELRHQMTILAEEVKVTAELANNGFVPKVQAGQIERSRSGLVAQIASNLASKTQTMTAISGMRLQLIQLMSVYHKEMDSQVSDLQQKQEAMAANVEALRFSKNITTIRAPEDGVVVGIKVNTVGGVVPGGALLMEIVPVGGHLVVDAQVPPMHIDKIVAGMPVDLRFSAFNLVNTPLVSGKVALVGADKQTTSSTSTTALAGQGTDFYLAQIEIEKEALAKLGDLVVQPGMPVEVLFKTGERNFFSLLMKPITDRFVRAFKEG